MLVRVLTATDMPVIEAVALSNADNKKWLGLDKSRFPLEHGAVVGLMGRLIALDYWRFFGAFDDAGKLLALLSFYFWCRIENGKYIPEPPNFFGYYNGYTSKVVSPHVAGRAHNAIYEYAFKYFAERAFTSRWVGIPADSDFSRLTYLPRSLREDWDETIAYKVRAGHEIPEGLDALPKNWKWMVGPSYAWPFDYVVIRNDARRKIPNIGFDPMSAAWTWRPQPDMPKLPLPRTPTCAVVDVETRVVLNVVVAAESDSPRVGTMLKRTPAPDGTDARAGLRWLDGSFEQPMIDAPIPWP